MDKQRCSWVSEEEIYLKYHDEEWGPSPTKGHDIPIHDEDYLFEMLCLEGAQAGLSWITILKRRENYREAFDYFNPRKVAKYNEEKVEELLKNEGIIRNKLKIRSVIKNAKAFLQVQEEFGSFQNYMWQFTDGKQIVNDWKSHAEVPASTKESEAMSKDLKKRGFSFVGPVICYSFMQAVGMVNDHMQDCYLYAGNV